MEKKKKRFKKCYISCTNCHIELHYKKMDTDLTDYIRPWIIKSCLYCKKGFDTKNESQIFCSESCKHVHSRSTRPTKEHLKILTESKSFVEIGRIYGVSDNAIRNWCKTYGLLYRKRDIIGNMA